MCEITEPIGVTTDRIRSRIPRIFGFDTGVRDFFVLEETWINHYALELKTNQHAWILRLSEARRGIFRTSAAAKPAVIGYAIYLKTYDFVTNRPIYRTLIKKL